jgi:hypothetical protein
MRMHYTDDIILLAPSVTSLQPMLDIACAAMKYLPITKRQLRQISLYLFW